LYRSRLRFFAGKLLSKWEGPFVVEEVYCSGAVKIASLKDNTTQVVNRQRIKHYIAGDLISTNWRHRRSLHINPRENSRNNRTM
jgi:hypothetical protein